MGSIVLDLPSVFYFLPMVEANCHVFLLIFHILRSLKPGCIFSFMLSYNAIIQVKVFFSCVSLPLIPPKRIKKLPLASMKYHVCIYSFFTHIIVHFYSFHSVSTSILIYQRPVINMTLIDITVFLAITYLSSNNVQDLVVGKSFTYIIFSLTAIFAN